MSVTVATIVVTGVTKRNHSVKSSAKFSGNQCGMRRSIGDARMNAKNPNNAGKHHQNENQLLPCGGRVSSRCVTNSSTSNNYNRLIGGGWGVLSTVGCPRFENSNYRSGSLATASRRPTSSSNFAAGCPRFRPLVPGSWVLRFCLNFSSQKQKGRAPVPGLYFTNWLRGSDLN
jgi:hypothetical protein